MSANHDRPFPESWLRLSSFQDPCRHSGAVLGLSGFSDRVTGLHRRLRHPTRPAGLRPTDPRNPGTGNSARIGATGAKKPAVAGRVGVQGRKDPDSHDSKPRPQAMWMARATEVGYWTASILVTANSPASLFRVPVTLTFLVWLQISPWKPLETSPVSL